MKTVGSENIVFGGLKYLLSLWNMLRNNENKEALT